MLDRDLGPIIRRGMTAGRRIGFKAQQATLSAFRRRSGDPLVTLERMIGRMVPLLRDAMIVAHYQGIVRVGQTTPEATQGLSLEAAAYSDSLRFLRKRFDLPLTELKLLAERYEAEAIRVTKSASASVEKRVQQSLLDTQGLHTADGVKGLRKAFVKAGLTPNNSFTLEAIFRTQTQMAYSAGRWHANQHPAIQEILWGYKYLTVGDDRVRPEHEALDGVTLPKDDPQWNVIYPPNGWACRCQVIEIFDEGEDIVQPPQEAEIDGRDVIPGADKGFRFNPGKVFGGIEPPRLKKIEQIKRIKRQLKKSTVVERSTRKFEKVGPRRVKPPKNETIQEQIARVKKEIAEEIASGGGYLSPEEWRGKPVTGKVAKAATKRKARERVAAKKPPTTPMEKIADKFGIKVGSIKNERRGKIAKEATVRVEAELAKMHEMFPDLAKLTKKEKLVKKIEIRPAKYIDQRGTIGTYQSRQIKLAGANPDKVPRVPNLGGKEFWGVDDSLEGALRHEYGHAVDVGAGGLRELGVDLERAWMKKGLGTGDDAWLKVSKYAGTNPSELYAESFCAYTHPAYGTAGTARLPRIFEEAVEEMIGIHPNLKGKP